MEKTPANVVDIVGVTGSSPVPPTRKIDVKRPGCYAIRAFLLAKCSQYAKLAGIAWITLACLELGERREERAPLPTFQRRATRLGLLR